MLERDLKMEAEKEMESGERLLWCGQPDAKRLAMQTLPLFIFAIPWTLFALFWETMACAACFGSMGKSGAGAGPGLFALIFPLFGIPFVLIGLGMLSSPYWAYKNALKTLYAVTDRRAFIVAPASWGGSKTVNSYRDEDIGNIERTERADGSGDLIFAREQYTGSRGSRGTRSIGFYGIPAVRKVADLMEKTFKSTEEEK
ncbi:MAG: hypothetical protein RDV48_27575 [Candidatus Eremiobacteraeota bacterium]|nr:hypothetical protein [Candidatus Eremiobacteraeota bacterium]